MNSRRNFILKSLFGLSAVYTGTSLIAPVSGQTRKSLAHKSPIRLGIAGYSFVNFNLEQSLIMMRRMDIRYLSIKDFHLPYKSTTEEISAFHKQLSESNVKGYAVGPIYMKKREEIDNAFEYAKRVGVNLIIGIPEVKDLEYVAEKVKAYDIRYAIHNHGPEDKIYPNATVVYNHIKNLDGRMGLCFDMGHNVRDAQDSVKDLIRYKDRIFDIHLKNVTTANAEGNTCELGRGIIDIPKFVSGLKKIKYLGVCSLEFEKDMKDPLAGLAESAGYFNGVVAAGK
ncbi:sugar phosphate isomerase/epimerase [Sphingobacterium sp. SRCM116780]|uniref:sugar phosphate isomerase/epimerase family protein n=1 Tax=Sphingobacterium sp. SRCM116780 TaxID=2907623 RepID=UPI001F24A19C|nr:sugar phosphate isomerase/epimerase [Sphingobacterium sp. SRCM116780]UIR57032.1 sugar phosphate isomerase/epimerase [Sphingobacterium sp. SRCM116780]